MKKLFTLLLLCCTLFAGAQTLKLKGGSVLTYKVVNGDKTYNYIVTIKSWEPDRVFDYEMTAPASLKATVTITPAALATATGQNNAFDGGPLLLGDKTTVWVSKVVFDGLKRDFQARVNPDSNGPITLLNNYEDKYPVLVDGKEANVNVIYAEEQSGKPYKYWILNDDTNPLIVKMDLGWSIELVDVKQ